MEPVQAEGGVIIPPSAYLQEVQASCRRHGALMVLDEIQTGLGRLGSWWGADRFDVVPDIMLVGKGLSGGVVPVSAVVATEEAFSGLNADPFLHTSTFAGSPLATATARAAIETMEQEGIVDRAAALGARLLPEVAVRLQGNCPSLVEEVRGVGLLIAAEFVDEGIAGAFVVAMLRHGVLVSHSLNSNRVVRLTPPAILSEEDVMWLLNAVDRSASSLAQQGFEPTPGRGAQGGPH